MSVVVYIAHNEFFISDVQKRYAQHEILMKYADFHVLSFTYIVDSVEVVGIILEA